MIGSKIINMNGKGIMNRNTGATINDVFLLLFAFGLGLLGLLIGHRFISPLPSSTPPAEKSEYVTKLEQQIEALTKTQKQSDMELATLKQQLQGTTIERNPTQPAASQSDANMSRDDKIEKHLQEAQTVLNDGNAKLQKYEEAFSNLEGDYAIRDLRLDQNNRLRNALEDVYDKYIDAIDSLKREEPTRALEKLRRLQNKNNALFPPKKYTLTQKQKEYIGSLVNRLSGA